MPDVPETLSEGDLTEVMDAPPALPPLSPPSIDRSANLPPPPLDAPLDEPRPRRRALPVAALLVALAGFLAYGGGALLYLRSLRDPRAIPGLRLLGHDLGGLAGASLEAAIARAGDPALDGDLALLAGGEKVRVRRRDAGFVVDAPALASLARATGRSGNPLADLLLRRRARAGSVELPLRFAVDRTRATEFLNDLKETVDRAPVDATLDLEKHTVAPERAGHLLQLYESLGRLEAIAAAGDRDADPELRELPSVAVAARVKKEDLASIDISTVLATWETHYSTLAVDSDRTYNLKVGASKLNGHILKPHELFSFNEVVGDRTEKEGYRVAPVIQGGELIDGLAGGMCQIASTLHAASFFAGLEIVSSRPHSRPSAYIPMGLDSTVVYPTTDLKIRNPFDFPIVMHYQVNQGAVRVELLGEARPYKVVFEREIVEEHPFGSSVRRDPEAPEGQRYVAQEGYPGYKATRRRYVFDAGTPLPKWLGKPDEPLAKLLAEKHIEPLKVEKWAIAYPSTEQINVVGSGSPHLKKKDPPPSHHIPPVPKDDKPFARIVR